MAVKILDLKREKVGVTPERYGKNLPHKKYQEIILIWRKRNSSMLLDFCKA
jgi:hypothetical protein